MPTNLPWRYVAVAVLPISKRQINAYFQVAFRMKKHMWEWFEEPGNEYRLKRFGVAMTGTMKLDPPNAIHLGFKWGDLPSGSLIVDVGGGLGHITMKLLQYHPQYKYIIQDRPPVIAQAREVRRF
jgi:O-methyltransferase domain